MKRHMIQAIFALLSNLYLPGFGKGTVYNGQTKYACVPGLNCYACPGAIGSCPIGALQAVIGDIRFLFSFYVTGTLLLFSTFFGRLICGYLCPFGLIQDLLYKIKSPKITVIRRVDKPLRMVKYLILICFVLLIPVLFANEFGIAVPAFCKYICPSGTLMGGVPILAVNAGLRSNLGILFLWKLFILLAVVISSVLIYRTFCKYLCPLGAIYGLFNRISFYKMYIHPPTCTGCKTCESICKMQVPVMRNINHAECIRCHACKAACPSKAIHSGFRYKPS